MPKQFHDWHDWQQAAKKRIPRFVFDFIEGGAGEEYALDRNNEAFRDICLIPSVLRDTSSQTTCRKLFGMQCSLPLAIAPTGLNGLVCPRADEMLARAAALEGVPFILSTAANSSMERVKAAANQPPWFQLYVINRDAATQLIRKADEHECPVLVITVDVPVSGKRMRDIRNGLTLPFKPGPGILRNCITRPRWSLAQLRARTGLSFPLLNAGPLHRSDDAKLFSRALDASITWDDIARLRDSWKRTLVIKGILDADDAAHACSLGVDGIVVSNHGGRQLESAPSTTAVMPGIVSAVGGRIPVMMDSGIRSGEDILKAIALGASGVLAGRLPLYGLAARGEQGVRDVLRMLKDQLLRSMSLLGCTSLEQVDGSKLLRRG